jgi:hypothetical protein
MGGPTRLGPPQRFIELAKCQRPGVAGDIGAAEFPADRPVEADARRVPALLIHCGVHIHSRTTETNPRLQMPIRNLTSSNSSPIWEMQVHCSPIVPECEPDRSPWVPLLVSDT